MKTGLKIRWTAEATKNLEGIIVYLEANWTSKELKSFFQKFEKQLIIISNFPEAYPLSMEKKKIHRCVFTKHLTISYTIENEFIVLLSIFDTRRQPSKEKNKRAGG
jgi:plasmid stabilization system protein ParE